MCAVLPTAPLRRIPSRIDGKPHIRTFALFMLRQHQPTENCLAGHTSSSRCGRRPQLTTSPILHAECGFVNRSTGFRSPATLCTTTQLPRTTSWIQRNFTSTCLVLPTPFLDEIDWAGRRIHPQFYAKLDTQSTRHGLKSQIFCGGLHCELKALPHHCSSRPWLVYWSNFASNNRQPQACHPMWISSVTLHPAQSESEYTSNTSALNSVLMGNVHSALGYSNMHRANRFNRNHDEATGDDISRHSSFAANCTSALSWAM